MKCLVSKLNFLVKISKIRVAQNFVVYQSLITKGFNLVATNLGKIEKKRGRENKGLENN